MTDMLSPITAPSVDARDLRPGLLVVSGDEHWDEARLAWNLAVDQRPAAVAMATSVDDIVAVVAYARERGLRVTAQGTGHNATPLGDLGDVILVKTHLMRGVEIDADAQVARVEAGALWIDVVDPAAEHGLAALHGSSPDVGVVGYTLGGGISWYGRRYGLASSRVLAIELVTAAGEHIRADRHHHAEVFWALRGGGGSFGIVTHMEFELIQIGEIQAGAVWFPVERATEVLQAWREWAPQLPDHVSTSARILNVPPMPEIPEPIRGKSFALVLVSILGDGDEAARHLAPLRALGPVMDTVKPTEVAEMVHLAMDPPQPVPAIGTHLIFDELSPAAVDAIVEQARAAKTLVVAHLTLGGGAMAHKTSDGALTHIDAPVLFFAAGIAPPELAATTAAEMQAVEVALAPYAADREYSSFTEKATDPARFWGADTYARLRAVKRAMDPHGYIVANHTVKA